MARLIPLQGKNGEGKFAIVDGEDYEHLSQYRWVGNLSRTGILYAITFFYEKRDKGIGVLMHRMILNAQTRAPIDHKNRNGLDNQKDNLRQCNTSQNLANTRGRGGTSQYKGVHFRTREMKWIAKLYVNGKEIHIGAFDTEIEAAKAYDKVAGQHWGEFAWLNFPTA